MANHIATSIPLERVRRIQNYINHGKSMAEIIRETGADYAINGTLYDMRTGRIVCHLKAEGKVLASPPYTVTGYSWDTGPDIRMDALPNASKNFVACTPLIVSGKKLSKLTYDRGQGGRRGRTAIGMKSGKLCLYCSKDGSNEARTPEKLRDLLVSFGWTSAVMLDGGGSSQCYFTGQRITSRRVVKHLILVYLKHDDTEPEGEKPMVEINAYSKANDGNKPLTSHFKVKEMSCNDGSDVVMVAPRLAMLLESIRTHFGKPVVINSGYRTPAYNKKVGGAVHSQHCYGTAADISIKGVSPQAVADYARQLMPDWGGVGVYKTFTHVDVREKRADWKG